MLGGAYVGFHPRRRRMHVSRSRNKWLQSATRRRAMQRRERQRRLRGFACVHQARTPLSEPRGSLLPGRSSASDHDRLLGHVHRRERRRFKPHRADGRCGIARRRPRRRSDFAQRSLTSNGAARQRRGALTEPFHEALLLKKRGEIARPPYERNRGLRSGPCARYVEQEDAMVPRVGDGLHPR